RTDHARAQIRRSARCHDRRCIRRGAVWHLQYPPAGAGSAGQGRPIRGSPAAHRGRCPDRDGQVRAVAVSTSRRLPLRERRHTWTRRSLVIDRQHGRRPSMCEICHFENLSHQAQPSRRSLFRIFGAAAAGLAFAGASSAKEGKTPKPQNVVSPDASLELLMKGNKRYVEGDSRRHDFKREREALVGGQNPYAGILSCADSRIAPEYAFDSGRGDLFVCRVAGNFANSDTIASMEYAVAMLGTPLIMVLGHDACGAVGATIKSLKDNITLPGHLPSLVT